MSGCGRVSCDNGAVAYRDPPGDPVQIGPDTWIQNMGGYGTRLCECRRSLPPRNGDARWWTSENVYSAEWASEVFPVEADITVTAEVPVSDDNYVVRRGYGHNRYYPTAVDVVLSRERRTFELSWLWPHEARDLGRKLIAAANAADAIDHPDGCARCGVWKSMCKRHGWRNLPGRVACALGLHDFTDGGLFPSECRRCNTAAAIDPFPMPAEGEPAPTGAAGSPPDHTT